MSAARRGLVGAFFLRAGFLVAAVAIIGGLLGMHIVAGGHSAHAGHRAVAEHSAPVSHAAFAGHSAHAAHGADTEHSARQAALPSAQGPALLAGASSCALAGNCPAMSGPDAGCVLAPGTATLTVPVPGTVPSLLPHRGQLHAGALASYSYLPGNPTPGDLCISRT